MNDFTHNVKHNNYSAFDIAHYCIYYCSQKLGQGISNLKLQKILYYVQAEFLVEKDMVCFNEPIVAWDYGPVIKDVYYEFRRFGANEMALNIEDNNITIADKKLINKVCKEKITFSAFELANKTHEEDPWKSTPNNCQIETDLIKLYFTEQAQNKL